MIRINLLETHRGRTGGALRTETVAVAGCVALALVATATAARSVSSRGVERAIAMEMTAAQAEAIRLAAELRDAADLERRRDAARDRLALVARWRDAQQAGVRIAEAIGRTVPDGMWLTRLEHEGHRLTIEGRCVSLAVLADFVAALESEPLVVRPIAIVSSDLAGARAAAPSTVRFTLRATRHGG